MAPALFQMQLDDGAWAITLATVQQVRVARRAGIDRIVLANEIVSPRDINYLLSELRNNPSLDIYCLVDSLEGVARFLKLAKAQPAGRPLNLLLELGYNGGRTGCRDVESALEVARAVKRGAPHLRLSGVEGFEGLHQYLPGEQAAPKVRVFLERLVELAERVNAEELFGSDEIILSAGGSAYYDLVTEIFGRARFSRATSTVLRSGCYLTHDAAFYERLFGEVIERSALARELGGGLQNTLEVWAYVLSVPESRRAILGSGRRDFGHDAGMPTPLKHFRPGHETLPRTISGDHEIVTVNDQHAHMIFPTDADVRVGDMVALGISHPCTTFDKWALLYIVNDNYDILSGVRTHF